MEIKSREVRQACEVEVIKRTSQTDACEVYADDTSLMVATDPCPTAWAGST